MLTRDEALKTCDEVRNLCVDAATLPPEEREAVLVA